MLILTSGDPFSVTVEIMAPLLHAARYRRHGLLVIGSAWQWRDQAQRLGLVLPKIVEVDSIAEVRPATLALLDVGDSDALAPAETLTPQQRGVLAVRALERLKQETLPQSVAVVTAPIDKHACRLAGFAHPGQTEFFEELWHAPAVMMLAGPRLRVGLATNHIALNDVAAAITASLVKDKLTLFLRTLASAFHIPRPRVAICGVNPHAGDQGLFGDEEATKLAPAIAAVRSAFPEVTIDGPVPADTAFYRALHGAYDGVLAMYHDQGLGPLKTVHFDDAINLSGGLPHFRASPDHGPAQDLFLRRQASPKSFAAAMDLALTYLDGASRG